MADHVHGSMNIKSQEKTFEGFIRVGIRILSISAAILIVLALFFR